MPTTDELAADLDLLRTQVPTWEEQLTTLTIPGWTSGGQLTHLLDGPGVAMTLLIAPFPLRILSVALSWEYWDQPGDDDTYWEARLDAGNSLSGFTDMAVRTTQLTGPDANGPVNSRTAWTFDAAAWLPGAADLAAGYMMRLVLNPRGGAGPMRFPLAVTTRWAAL